MRHQKNRSHKTVVSENTLRQRSHGSFHQAEPEVTKKPYPWRKNVREARLHEQQPRVDFFSRTSSMDRTRCGELNSRPSDAAVEFDVRPKVPREAARLAHSLPPFPAWLHTWWLLLVFGLQQKRVTGAAQADVPHCTRKSNSWQSVSCRQAQKTP